MLRPQVGEPTLWPTPFRPLVLRGLRDLAVTASGHRQMNDISGHRARALNAIRQKFAAVKARLIRHHLIDLNLASLCHFKLSEVAKASDLLRRGRHCSS